MNRPQNQPLYSSLYSTLRPLIQLDARRLLVLVALSVGFKTQVQAV